MAVGREVEVLEVRKGRREVEVEGSKLGKIKAHPNDQNSLLV